MANMRTMMPALQKAKTATLEGNGLQYVSVSLPKQQRTTRVEKDMTADEIAPSWLNGSEQRMMESILVLTHADETGAALSKGSLEAVTAGKELASQLGAQSTIGIVAEDARMLRPSYWRKLARACWRFRRGIRAGAVCERCGGVRGALQMPSATIVLAPGSSRFARVMAAVAHRLGGSVDTHITASARRKTLRQRGGSIGSGLRR